MAENTLAATLVVESPINSFKPCEGLPPRPHENVAQDRLSGDGDVLVVDALHVLGVVGNPMIFGNRDADTGSNAMSVPQAIHHLIWPHVLQHVAKDHKLCGVRREVLFPRLGVRDVEHLINEIGTIHAFIKCVKVNIDDALRIRCFQSCWILVTATIQYKAFAVVNSASLKVKPRYASYWENL